jgi:C-terminal processing protease CtpA/Prc
MLLGHLLKLFFFSWVCTGFNTKDVSDDRMSSLLLGEEGTSLQVVVIRHGENIHRTFNLARTHYQEGISSEFSRMSVSTNCYEMPILRQGPSKSGTSVNPSSKGGLGIVFQQVSSHKGLLVRRLKDEGPAALSGKVHIGDVVLAIDGRPLFPGISATELSEIVQVRRASIPRLVTCVHE